MKIRVLYPTAFLDLDPVPEGSDIVDVPEARANGAILNGYAEQIKVERATKAPGEKSNVTKPKPEEKP